LSAVRLLLHAASDPGHREDRQRGSEEEVEHRLVQRHVGRADLQVHPVLELELVLGLEVVVLAVVAEDDDEGDAHREVDPETEQDLLPSLHCCDASSSPNIALASWVTM
jgi:hypothetical protein